MLATGNSLEEDGSHRETFIFFKQTEVSSGSRAAPWALGMAAGLLPCSRGASPGYGRARRRALLLRSSAAARGTVRHHRAVPAGAVRGRGDRLSPQWGEGPSLGTPPPHSCPERSGARAIPSAFAMASSGGPPPAHLTSSRQAVTSAGHLALRSNGDVSLQDGASRGPPCAHFRDVAGWSRPSTNRPPPLVHRLANQLARHVPAATRARFQTGSGGGSAAQPNTSGAGPARPALPPSWAERERCGRRLASAAVSQKGERRVRLSCGRAAGAPLFCQGEVSLGARGRALPPSAAAEAGAKPAEGARAGGE